MESRLGRSRPKVDKVDHKVSHDSGSTIVVDYDIGDGDHEEAQLTRSAPEVSLCSSVVGFCGRDLGLYWSLWSTSEGVWAKIYFRAGSHYFWRVGLTALNKQPLSSFRISPSYLPLDGPVGRLSGTTSDGGQQKSGIISEFGMNMNIGKFLRERAAMFVSNKESCEFCRLLVGRYRQEF
nr:hypothetical protein Iba_chr08dCG11770 [Ipomoea batatas]